jgi:hypothetical protein
MNKKTFNQTLNQIEKTLVANYRSVKTAQLDTSKFRYVNDLSYSVDTKNWKIQIDYNQSEVSGDIKKVADRTMGIYFSTTKENANPDRKYKAIYVYDNESTGELYDYTIVVDLSINGDCVANYRKLVDKDDLSREIINSALGNS